MPQLLGLLQKKKPVPWGRGTGWMDALASTHIIHGKHTDEFHWDLNFFQKWSQKQLDVMSMLMIRVVFKKYIFAFFLKLFSRFLAFFAFFLKLVFYFRWWNLWWQNLQTPDWHKKTSFTRLKFSWRHLNEKIQQQLWQNMLWLPNKKIWLWSKITHHPKISHWYVIT